MRDDLQFSRPLAAAATLGDLAPDCHRFVSKRVLITGEDAVLATPNGQESFLSSLRLVIRICPNVVVALPRGANALVDDCQRLADKITFAGRVEFVSGLPAFTGFDAILSVGTVARPDLPWTVINSDGWLARVSSGGTNLKSPARSAANPIGALGAACFGVTEVFKRLIRLKACRGHLLDGSTFSFHSYICGDQDPGPDLPAIVRLNLLLIGAGAIGNGIVHLLRELPVAGRASVVDSQKYGKENLGTCLLIGPTEVGTQKAVFAEAVLSGCLDIAGFHEDLSAFARRLGRGIPYPEVILTGVDNIDARYEAQAIWPDLLIDGAIGDFPCQVSRHEMGVDGACLMCLFRHPPGADAGRVASRATGLRRSRILQPEATIDDEDVRAAPPGRQTWLQARLGRPVCSVVSEGVAQQISLDEQAKGFAPSVPFVACLSACMAVGELVKHSAGWPSVLETRFQFDVLRGPTLGSMIPQQKQRDCDCAARARNIEIWRRQRH